MSLLQCNECLENFPVEMFPNLSIGPVCRSCMTGRDTKKAEERIKEKAKSLAGNLVSLEHSDLADDLTKVRSLLSDIYRDFGGTTGFASHLHWVIMELSNRRPLPTSVGQLMLNLMRLHHQIEQTEEQIAAREMTDEQLRRETELATIQMFVDSAGDPEKRKMLEQVLGKHGLTIQEADPQLLLANLAEDDDG